MNAKKDTPTTASKQNNNDYLLSQSFFNNTPIAIVIYKVINEGQEGKDYIIENVNPKALKIENWIKEDIVGKPLSLVRPGVDDFGIIEVFQKVWKTGELSYFPARIYDNNGELKWFENTIFKLPTGQVVASYNDVTEQKLSEERLENEKERLRVTLYSIEDGVITTNSQGEVLSLNKVAEQLTGWTSKEAKGHLLNKVFDVFDKITTAPSDNLANQVLKSKQVIALKEDSILRSVNGHTSPISGNIAPINRQDGSTIGTVLVFRDITEAKKREEKINYLSFKDSLTGLYNRAYFEEALVRYDVQSQMPVSLIMGDLDGLKLINDVFGHQAGDDALIKLAEIFIESCRSLDIISRWGGDEFVILLPKTSEDVAEKVCARIIEACDRTIVSDTILSVSLGYPTKTDLSQNWKNIFKVAEDNMYKNKLLGAKSYRNIVISSMKNALYEKSDESREQAEKLSCIAREVGLKMGLSSIELDELELLATLHDIGKIAIDSRILQKSQPLTKSEWNVLKQHPEIGYRIACTVPELINIAEYILTHRERWDGKGYPRGLSGKQIPLLSRILSVVDAYYAMTQERVYRKVLSKEEALEELEVNAGTQFDPEIVSLFINFIKDKELS